MDITIDTLIEEAEDIKIHYMQQKGVRMVATTYPTTQNMNIGRIFLLGIYPQIIQEIGVLRTSNI